MNIDHTISAILRGAWLIDKSFADAHLPLIAGILTGKVSGASFFDGKGSTEPSFLITPEGKKIPAYIYNYRSGEMELNKEIPKNSIAVVNMIGPVLKYSGQCGEPGTAQRASWTEQLIGLKEVKGFITYIDCPGGQADGTPQYANVISDIRNIHDKPSRAFINGGAYSGGAWIASAHEKIYLESEFSAFGSIGAYTTIVDYAGYFKKNGVVVRDIYPEVSRDKNKSYREALKGNDKLILEEIGALAEGFINSFSENRSGQLTSDEWNTGKVFKGQKAVDIGLVDGIMSFNNMIAELQEKKIISTPPIAKSKSNNTMKLENVTALSGVENPTDEQIADANGDLRTNNISSVILVESSFLDAAAQATTDLESLRATHEATVASLAAANETIATNTATLDANATEIATLKTSLSRRGASTAPAVSTEGDTNEGLTEVQKLDNEIHALPHYNGVLDNPLFAKN